MMKGMLLTLTIAGTALLAGCHERHVYRHDSYEPRIAVVRPAPVFVVRPEPRIVVVEPPPRHHPPVFGPAPHAPDRPPATHGRDQDREPPRHRR